MTNPNLFPALCPTWNRTALYYHTGNPRHLNTKRVKHLAFPVPPYSTYSRHAGRRRDGHGKPAKILRSPPVLPVQEVVNHFLHTSSRTLELAVRQTDVQRTRVHHTSMPYEAISSVLVPVIAHDGTATATNTRQRSTTDVDKEANDT